SASPGSGASASSSPCTSATTRPSTSSSPRTSWRTSKSRAAPPGSTRPTSRSRARSAASRSRACLSTAAASWSSPAWSPPSTANPGALGNNYQRVTIGGTLFLQTRINVDGSTVVDRINGGTAQNFSQESVQEFQISTFAFDPATGTTGTGAVNVVTRRGGND